MDTVELIMKIEDRFSIRIPNREAEQIFTVGDIYNAVFRHLANDSYNFSEVQKTINEIIADHAGLDVSEIRSIKSITSDLGLD